MVWLKSIDKSLIHPGLVSVTDVTHEALESEGVPFKTYSGTRTFAEQDDLYALGRTADGVIVTKARGGQSMHNYGLADDSAPLKDPTKPQGEIYWPNPHTVEGKVWFKFEDILVKAVKHLKHTKPGFADHDVEYEWGGRWEFRDTPHVQIRTTLIELATGHYPRCADVEWLVKAHTTFLFNTPWIWRRIQHLLNIQSYDAGPVDGNFGSRSSRAWNQFRADQQIPKDDNESDYNRAVVERLVRLHQTAMSTPRGTLPEDLVG